MAGAYSKSENIFFFIRSAFQLLQLKWLRGAPILGSTNLSLSPGAVVPLAATVTTGVLRGHWAMPLPFSCEQYLYVWPV